VFHLPVTGSVRQLYWKELQLEKFREEK